MTNCIDAHVIVIVLPLETDRRSMQLTISKCHGYYYDLIVDSDNPAAIATIIKAYMMSQWFWLSYSRMHLEIDGRLNKWAPPAPERRLVLYINVLICD